jgi:bifunctional enzyme CysN/CysC
VLDGKSMRLGISKDLPHDQEGRAENLRRSSHVARFLNDSGLICCAAFVAPNRDSREHALSIIGKDNCLIVYLNPAIEVCQQRDPSGLYAAAELSESADIPGISFVYDEPDNADLQLDTEKLSVDQCLDQVIQLMKDRGII